MQEQMAICYDSHSCIRCFACMVNCAQENRVRLQRDQGISLRRSASEYRPHLVGLRPIQHEVGTYPDSRRFTQVLHCFHCEDAQCMDICPANAITRRSTGAVVINEALCSGCRACYDACPFSVPQYDTVSGKSHKCIMCYDRVEAGKPTACVEGCVTGAMFMGPRLEVIDEAEKRVSQYNSIHGKEYIIYGKDRINNHVGTAGWLTIAPLEHQEYFGLEKDPFKTAIVLRNITKYVGGFGVAGAALAFFAHNLWWQKKIREESAGEPEGGSHEG